VEILSYKLVLLQVSFWHSEVRQPTLQLLRLPFKPNRSKRKRHRSSR